MQTAHLVLLVMCHPARAAVAGCCRGLGRADCSLAQKTPPWLIARCLQATAGQGTQCPEGTAG